MFIAADKVQEWLREARHSKAEPLVHGSDENYRQPCKLSSARLLGTHSDDETRIRVAAIFNV